MGVSKKKKATGAGRYGVMCCGCYRVLGRKGELVPTGGGYVAWNDMAVFESYEEADKRAQGLGWHVRDGEGRPDHRCPECVANPRTEPLELPAPFAGMVSDRGAYIEIPEGEGDGD